MMSNEKHVELNKLTVHFSKMHRTASNADLTQLQQTIEDQVEYMADKVMISYHEKHALLMRLDAEVEKRRQELAPVRVSA